VKFYVLKGKCDRDWVTKKVEGDLREHQEKKERTMGTKEENRRGKEEKELSMIG